MLESMDVLRGDFLLKDWTLSKVNFYFTETLPKSALLLLGFLPQCVLSLAPALYWGTAVYLSGALLFKKAKNRFLSLFLLLGLMGLPVSGVIYQTNIHIGCLIGALFLLTRMDKDCYPSRFESIFLVIFIGMLVFSDPLVNVFFTVPTVLACIAVRFFSRKHIEKRWLLITSFGVGSAYLGYFILSYLDHWQQYGAPTSLNLGQFFNSLKTITKGCLDWFGILPHFQAPLTCFSLLLLLVLVGRLFLRFGKNLKEHRLPDLSFVDWILFFGAISSFSACILHGSDAPVVRYALPALVFFVVFLCRNLNKERPWIVAIAAVIFLSSHFKSNIDFYYRQKAPESLDTLWQFLQKEGIEECFSSYDLGVDLMFIRNKPNFVSAPITLEEGHLEAVDLLHKSQWYQQPKRCYLTNFKEDIENASKLFGSDYKLYNFSGYDLKSVYVDSDAADIHRFSLMLYPENTLVAK